MNEIRKATIEDFPYILGAFKLYKKEGKFQYIRNDYLKRCIESGEVYLGFDTVAIIRQMKRKGKIGNYQYDKGFWNISQILSANKDNSIGPFSFFRNFLNTFVNNDIGGGIVYGTVHDTNEQSIKWHEAIGFKKVGTVEWSEGTIKGSIYSYVSR